MLRILTVLALALPALAQPAPPLMVRLPAGAPVPEGGGLTPWHPEPFGDPVLAEAVGLTRWYLCDRADVPAGLTAYTDSPGTTAAGGWPDDPLLPQQWGMRNDGTTGGLADIDVDGVAALRLFRELHPGGGTLKTLAVVDTDMIAATLYPFELWVTKWWNAVLGVPYHVNPPSCQHAVHVASIAASVQNITGMAGLAWGPRTQTVAVQVLTGCSGFQAVCAGGVAWVADNGAAGGVINMSLQYGLPKNALPVFEAACKYAVGRDIVVVAASGNYSWTENTAVPSCFDSVLAVGAIDRLGRRAGFSNAGPQLDLCAPGVDVLGIAGLSYEEWSGTSMAAPHVAGAALLIRQAYPALTVAQVRAALETTADDMGAPGHDWEFGHGRLNAYRALHAANPCYGDFNRDGALNLADFGAFQTAYAAGQHRANCDGDLTVDDDPILTLSDFGCFQTKFAAGCP